MIQKWLMSPRQRCLPDIARLTCTYELTETVIACTGPAHTQARRHLSTQEGRHDVLSAAEELVVFHSCWEMDSEFSSMGWPHPLARPHSHESSQTTQLGLHRSCFVFMVGVRGDSLRRWVSQEAGKVWEELGEENEYDQKEFSKSKK